jgi:hypothetical protein
VTFPVAAARTTTTDASTLNSHPIGLGSPSAGDLLIVFATANGPVGDFFIDEAASGIGWRHISTLNGLLSLKMSVYCKIAAGGDALTLLTSATVRMASICYRITGHGSSVAFGTMVSGFGSNNGDPPSASITGAAQDVLYLAALAANAVVPSAGPASYTDFTTANSTHAVMCSAERNLNGTTDNPGVFTHAFAEWISATIAIPEIALTAAMRLTQAPVESLTSAVSPLRVTQLSAETVSTVSVAARMSQLAIEVVSTNDNVVVTASPSMLFIAT